MPRNRNITWIAATPSILIGALVVGVAVAGSVTLPHTFVPGQVADANQVNANMTALATEINDNDMRIATLDNTVTTSVGTLQTDVGTLQADVTALQAMRHPLAAARVLTQRHNITLVYSTLTSGFNNLPGGTGPTVTRNGAGDYTVEFGSSLNGRLLIGSIARHYGVALPGNTLMNPTAGSVAVRQLSDGATSVNVLLWNAAGASADLPFHVMIH